MTLIKIKLPALVSFICIMAFAAAGTASSAANLAADKGVSANFKPGRCLLEVDGRRYISGACRIDMEKGGSFQIYDLKKRGYFAYVDVNGSTAEGYWNEEPGANHAHSPLGTLTRDGACWTNDRAKVCAWR